MKIAVALSGGVDSSVAAALLQAEGHEVVGITLQQWPRGADSDGRHGGCCSLSAVEDARRVAGILGIPYYVWNLEREFGERVIAPFHDAYRMGRTPNPCVACNAFVRFDLMLGRVLGLGFDLMASGHYARVTRSAGGRPQLHSAKDPAKDQSYMLYHLSEARLAHLTFPLGIYRKAEVRELAAEFKLPVATKPESQEICFVPLGRTADYLAHQLPVTTGEVVDSRGRVLGTHRGTPLYTVGQRSGFASLSEPGPWYVLSVDAPSNRLVVGRRTELETRSVQLREVSFIDGSDPDGAVACEARLRYHADPIPAVYERGTLSLERPFLGAAPGQAAVLYEGGRVLGGGLIAAQAPAAAASAW